MYRDASKSQAGVGGLVIFNGIKLIYKLPNVSSMFTTESLEILNSYEP